MAAVLFVELPSANTEAAAGDRGGFFIAQNDWRPISPACASLASPDCSGKNPHPACLRLARPCPLG